jgi:GxxExxY protein
MSSRTLNIHRGDAEARRFDELTDQVIGACIEVHRVPGPGLLESAYEECLCHELSVRNLAFERQVPLPVQYKAVKLECGYRLDLVVKQQLVLELKAIEALLPIHEAQLLTYLKLSGKTCGLLVNFHVPALKDGLKRIVNQFPDLSAPPRLRGERKNFSL